MGDEAMSQLIDKQHLLSQLDGRPEDGWISIKAVRAMIEAEEEDKTEKALRLLVEWAIECDFGYDNIPEEYEKYKDEIENMGYTEGLIYIAKMEIES